MSEACLKGVRWNSYDLFAAGAILLAIIVRIVLMLNDWPRSDSEEGTMGLEAMHIAFRGEHPIYLYGQHYMGVGEAYLGALMFRIFGVSVFSLRLGMLLLFTAFLVVLYLLASLLYSKRVGLVSLLLLVCGSREVMIPEMKAVGGVVEILVCGALVFLLASWLAITHEASADFSWRRALAYAGWGLAAGAGLWSHFLVAPFIICSALLLIYFCWREIRTKVILWLVFGFLIGALPLIIYNIRAPLSENSLVVFWELHHTYYPQAPTGLTLWLKQLCGTFFFTLPLVTGMSQAGPLQALPFYGSVSTASVVPMLIQGGWSFAYLALLIWSTLLACNAVRLSWRKRTVAEASSKAQHTLALEAARLLLLLSGWLTLLAYAISATAAERPWSYRYLMGLLIMLPALTAPLLKPVKVYERLKFNWRNLALVLVGLILVYGTLVNLRNEAPYLRMLTRQQDMFIQHLLQRHITHIYSGYWVCDRLIFHSQEQVICDVKFGNMQPGLTRYLPYRRIVQADPDAAYVFTETTTDFAPAAAMNAFAHDPHYQQLRMDGYIVYVPIT